MPYFSSPLRTYNGRVTGTATQDNARALNDNLPTILAFRAAVVGSPEPDSAPDLCMYTLSTTSLAFDAASGFASLSVRAGTDCGWTTSSDDSWVQMSPGGTGVGVVTLYVDRNTGPARTAQVTIAGETVVITQRAARAKSKPRP